MDKKKTEFDVSSAQWKKATDHKNFYANNIGLAVSLHDFQLRLGIIVVEDQTATNTELATVFLSPSHAKAVGAMLSGAAMEYEREHNIVLPLPDHLKAAKDKK